LRYTPRKTTQI